MLNIQGERETEIRHIKWKIDSNMYKHTALSFQLNKTGTMQYPPDSKRNRKLSIMQNIRILSLPVKIYMAIVNERARQYFTFSFPEFISKPE